MMKYTTPDFEILYLNSQDIITTSGEGGNTPIVLPGVDINNG